MESLPPARRYDTLSRTASRIDRPTQTLAPNIGVPSLPASPKVVVLGATGGVGRRVVKRLMGTDVDMTVVAFCRTHGKAMDVLFDDLDEDGVTVKRRGRRSSRRRGPKLEVVVGDLVPAREVYGYREEEDDDEVEFNSTMDSIRKYYGESAADEMLFDSSGGQGTFDANEALRDAVKGCTVIISCVGTVRTTNPWTDYLRAPWRIFRRDASRWCRDANHPHYVNYWTTAKVLDLAEKEQRRREAEIAEFEQSETEIIEEARSRGMTYGEPIESQKMRKGLGGDRIKIIRISDLALTCRPWGVVAILTNLARSLVLRDQDRCERILEESKIVDTIIFRPGDLTDDDRVSIFHTLPLSLGISFSVL